MNQLWRILLISVPICALYACSGIPLSTLIKLRSLSPLDADPNQIRIALVSDQILQFSDKSVVLTLSYQANNQAQSVHTELFVSQLSSNKGTLLDGRYEAHEKVTIFFLDKAQAQVMSETQARIRQLKAEGVEGKGHLSVQVTASCFIEPPPDNLPTDFYIQLSQDQDFILLQNNFDLIKAAQKADVLNEWVTCL